MKKIIMIVLCLCFMNSSVFAASHYDYEKDINIYGTWSLQADVYRVEVLAGSPAKAEIQNKAAVITPTDYGDIKVLIYSSKRKEPYSVLLHCVFEEERLYANITTPPPVVDQALINQAFYEHNYYGSTISEAQIAEAEAIAKSIADSIRNNPKYKNDIMRVKAAARAVASRSAKHLSLYGSDENKYYRSPYGVLVTGNFTCAGATRTVGRILDYMGYKWTHVNENEWLHQWCILEMDGQIGYADGNVIPEGKVGYGKYWSGLKQVEEALKAQNNE